jgi:hypothetical protein
MYRPTTMIKGLAAALAAITTTVPAHAEEEDDDGALFSSPSVSDDELDEQRGGFAFAGMEIKLGADIRTFLNSELALHTVITMDELGYNRVQTVSAGLTLADADALRNSALSNGAIRMNVGDNQVYLANQGQTAIIHGNEGALQNILINTASNITASQDVTATLDLSGYDGFAATITADQLGRSLGDDVTRAISGAFGG